MDRRGSQEAQGGGRSSLTVSSRVGPTRARSRLGRACRRVARPCGESIVAGAKARNSPGSRRVQRPLERRSGRRMMELGRTTGSDLRPMGQTAHREEDVASQWDAE
jgi:hypothetical protein